MLHPYRLRKKNDHPKSPVYTKFGRGPEHELLVKETFNAAELDPKIAAKSKNSIIIFLKI